VLGLRHAASEAGGDDEDRQDAHAATLSLRALCAIVKVLPRWRFRARRPREPSQNRVDGALVVIERADEQRRFFEDDDALLDAVAAFLGEGLARGEPALAVLTPPHAVALRARLGAGGDRLVTLDAEQTLSLLMEGALPSAARFDAAIGAPLRSLAAGGRVRAFGELVDLLWRDGNVAGALALEDLWNDLSRSGELSLLCASAMASFYRETGGRETGGRETGGRETGGRETGGREQAGAPADDARVLAAEIARRQEIEAALRGSVRDLRRVEDELRASDRRLRVITDALPVLVSYIDRGLRYRFVNSAYERWFGVPQEQVLGREMSEILGDAAQARLRPHLDAALAGHQVTYRARVPYRHGGERHVEATYVPHRDGAGDVIGFVALVSDVSERERLEQAREDSARRTERLMRITAALADAVTPAQVHGALVDQVASALGASSAGLYLVDDAGLTAVLARSVGYTQAQRDQLRALPLEGPARIPAIDVIRGGAALWLDSREELVTTYPQVASLVTPERSYRIACLPIAGQGMTRGCLALTFDDAPPLDEDEKIFLLLVARYAGQAQERLRLLDAERQNRERAEANAARMLLLGRASRVFTEAGPAVLERAVAEVTLHLADACAISLAGARGETLELAAHRAPDPEAEKLVAGLFAAAPLRAGEGLSGQVVASGEGILIPEVDQAALAARIKVEHRALWERFPPVSLVAVPLRARGRAFGAVVAIRHRRPGFSEDDRWLMQELADRAAMAIESNRLHADNQRALVRAELLYGLAAGVIGATRVEEVYEAALDAIERALGAPRSSILVFDEEGVMRFRAWRGLSDAYRAAVDGHSPWQRDARAPEPIVVDDVERDPGVEAYLPVFRAEGIGALGFFPLVAAGRLVGKFMVYYDRAHVLGPDEVELARAIGNHVAAAVARFHADDELRETVRFNELFTGILGHDLRNPLFAIMTAAELALKRGGHEKLGKPLSRILNSGERMARMIDQLLDFTRVRVGGGIRLAPAAVDLLPLVRQVMDELDDANPEWTLRLDHDGDTAGVWDADRLSQVFSNLVANAVRHGVAEHGVRVRIDGGAADGVTVEIHNRGAIPAAVLPRLFEPMAGGDRRRDKAQGLGLGLYISREILRAHGGRLDVRSSDDEGTTFTVWLPRAGRA
jgi:PAS domain S-box-containing protein